MRHPKFPGAANIGLELGTRLLAVGIDSVERLEEVGAREAWLRLRVQFPECDEVVWLLALQGAIDDVLVPKLPAARVAELKRWHAVHCADE